MRLSLLPFACAENMDRPVGEAYEGTQFSTVVTTPEGWPLFEALFLCRF